MFTFKNGLFWVKAITTKMVQSEIVHCASEWDGNSDEELILIIEFSIYNRTSFWYIDNISECDKQQRQRQYFNPGLSFLSAQLKKIQGKFHYLKHMFPYFIDTELVEHKLGKYEQIPDEKNNNTFLHPNRTTNIYALWYFLTKYDAPY